MADRFSEARRRLAEVVGSGGIAVIPSNTEVTRSNDVTFDFHQDPDFLYLTGFNEPDSVAVIAPAHPEGEYLLFVRPRDPDAEVWDGFRAGVEGAKERFGADAAFETDRLEELLAGLLTGRDALWYSTGNQRFDSEVTGALAKARRRHDYLGVRAPSAVHDVSRLVAEMRLTKTVDELDLLSRVSELSAGGHIEAMRFAAPGQYEYQVQHAMEYVWRQGGSRHNGYPSIVASGSNACILHYVDNDRRMEDGDLLLIDAAAEIEGYSADITRTFPVSGRFTAPQRALYEVVLRAERDGIARAVAGSSMSAVHDAAARTLTEGLVELGLLPLGVEESMAMNHYRQFFLHGVGHWLGLDVHDAGANRIDGVSRPLEVGMVFTVEPGLYLSPDKPTFELSLLEYDLDTWMKRRVELGAAEAKKLEEEEKASVETISHEVPEEFLGLGVRIEDDIAVTAEGNLNLSVLAPVEIDDIEAVCAETPRLPRP